MRNFKFVSLMTLLLFLVTAMGCSQDKQTAQDPNEQGSPSKPKSNETIENQPEPTEKTNTGQTEPELPPIKDQGKLNIWYKGHATIKDHDIIVDGRTNLLPGSHLWISLKGVGVTFIGTNGIAKVKENGTFHFEDGIPSDYFGLVKVEVEFKPENQVNDKIQEHYSPTMEKLKGPFIYLREEDDELAKVARAQLEIQMKKSKPSTVEIVKPKWDQPDDYASPKIWIKQKITTDKDFIYVKGTSNLVEGTKIKGSFQIPGKFTIGYTNFTRVNPDGSFQMSLSNPEQDDAKHFSVNLEVTPNEDSWPNVIKAYGENGSKLKGKLVESKDEGGKKIVKKIKVQ